MKKVLLLSALLAFLPLTMLAQDDDMYFVPKKKTPRQIHSSYTNISSSDTYYSGSTRDVDEYNRMGPAYRYGSGNSSEVIPDSLSEDYKLTRKMSRWEGYTPAEAYWEGYDQGRADEWSVSVWHSPWCYTCYDPWYYYPYCHPHWSWSISWGWGWGGPWYRPWHWHPWHYRPWIYRPYYVYVPRNTVGVGTINRYGRSHGSGSGYRGSSSGTISSSGGERSYTYGRGNANSRSTTTTSRSRSYNSNRSYNYGTTRNQSYSTAGSRSSSIGSSSRSGSFSSGSRGGSFGGGSFGGGSRGGGFSGGGGGGGRRR